MQNLIRKYKNIIQGNENLNSAKKRFIDYADKCLLFIKTIILKTGSDERYYIFGKKHSLSISRPVFIIIIAIVMLATVLIALTTWNKISTIEKIESQGDSIVEPIEPDEPDDGRYTFTKKSIYKRYDCAYGLFSQELHKQTLKLIRQCKNSAICHTVAVYKYVTQNIELEKDIPIGSRPLKKPAETWQSKSGTSEDMAVLASTMLYALGHETQIKLTPTEAFTVIYNFDEDEFIKEIVDFYRQEYGLIKKMTIPLNAGETHYLQIKEDHRFYPLTIEITSSTPFDLVHLRDDYELERWQEGKDLFVDPDYKESNIKEYKNDISVAKNSYLAIKAFEPGQIIYAGYMKDDPRVDNYIRSLLEIQEQDGSKYHNHASMLFTFGKKGLPGQETQDIVNLRQAKSLIDLPIRIMSKKFLAPVDIYEGS